MAGIGEATAIIAVAQAGISLSMVIIAYVGDVRDAPSSVARIGNEIKSTSGRLQEIAEIIRDNPVTGLLLDSAVGDATRCSSECELILAQVGNLLVKGGWKRDSTELSKDDIDTSVVASLKWPFLKTRLETPRVELQRIKADLMLLFNVAMARKSSTPLKNEYARKIPLLTRKKEEAARKAWEARQKARESQDDEYMTGKRRPRASRRRTEQLAEEDSELYQQYREFELQRAKDQEDRTIQERAALLQAEEERKKKAEEDAQREIAQKAVEDYRLQQEELKAKTMAREKQLSDELSALGLSPEQTASILAVPSLNVENAIGLRTAREKSTESQRTSVSEAARRPKSQRKRRSGFPINLFPWGGHHNSRWNHSESSSVKSKSQGNESLRNNHGLHDEVSIEIWLVDVFSRQHTEIEPAERWLSQKLKTTERSHDVWHRFAQLQPMWRIAIQDFLDVRNKAQRPERAWKLIHIGLPRRMTKMSFFGHHHRGHLVRLMVSQQKSAVQSDFSDVVAVVVRRSRSTVKAETYLPRRLVSISAIIESSYDYEESFEVPSYDATSELQRFTDETHVMIPEEMTLKQVNTLASLTKSFMESGKVPWVAQPPFTYRFFETVVEERVDGNFAYNPGQALGRLAPVRERAENQQQVRKADHGPENPRGSEDKVERSIEYLKKLRVDIGESPDSENRVWFREIDSMIGVLESRFSRLGTQNAKIGNDEGADRRPSTSHTKPYLGPAARSSKNEMIYGGGDLQSRNVRPASFHRGNMDRWSPSRMARMRLNLSLAERGLQMVPEDDLESEFSENLKRPGHYKDYDEKAYGPERALQGMMHQPRESIEGLNKGSKKKSNDYGTQTKDIDLTRPTYIKVHRKHMSPATLDEYELPWEWDDRDPNYIIVKKWLPEPDQLILFEHTRAIRERELLVADIKRRARDDDRNRDQERPKRGRSLNREDTWPNGRRSQALVLSKPRDRFISHKYPSRQSTYNDGIYDEGIRVRAIDTSSSLSPVSSPHDTPYDALKENHPLSLPPSTISRQPAFSKEVASDDKSGWEFRSRQQKSLPSSRVALQSKAHAPRSVKSSEDEDEDDDDGNDDGFPEPVMDKDDADADLIAETLSRYTTFNINAKVAASAKSSSTSEADAPESPTTRKSPSPSLHGHHMRLEDVNPGLGNVQTEWIVVEEEHDSVASSDSSYLPAIPETQRRIKEKEGEMRSEAEVKAGKTERAARTHSVGSGRSSVPSLVASPIAAEDGGARADDSPKTTEKAISLSRDRRKGTHADPANDEEEDYYRERASHPSKKKKNKKKFRSTDDLRDENLADPPLQPTSSANHTKDHAAPSARSKKTKQDHSPTPSTQDRTRSSTSRKTRRPSRSFSSSESDRAPARRADTQLYEADSEGSGRGGGAFGRRDTWRRPTVEDEDVEEGEELYE